jgi:hypothetical protein
LASVVGAAAREQGRQRDQGDDSKGNEFHGLAFLEVV